MIIVGLCAQCVWWPTRDRETHYRSQASINVDELKNCLLVLLGFPKRSLEGLCLYFESFGIRNSKSKQGWKYLKVA